MPDEESKPELSNHEFVSLSDGLTKTLWWGLKLIGAAIRPTIRDIKSIRSARAAQRAVQQMQQNVQSPGSPPENPGTFAPVVASADLSLPPKRKK